MLLFRSEEHVERWCSERGVARGALLTLESAHRLAREWYADRLEESWRRKTPDEAQAAFERVGLTGEFWRVT